MQRDPGSHRPGQQAGSVAVIFLSTLPSKHADLPFPACPAVHRKKVRLQEAGAGQSRAELGRRRQHTADAAGQAHLLLLHILAQAPCPECWIQVNCFPDPNREPAASVRLKKQGMWHHAACSRIHIIYDGAKAKLSFFHTMGPVVDLGFSCSGSKDRLTLCPSPSADLLLPRMEEVMAPNDTSQPRNCQDPEPLRA